MICLVDSFNDLITKDRGCISLESTQKIILFIRAFSKLKFYPNDFVFRWKDLSKYFNYPKSLLHIMQIMNYELTREAIHNHIDNICAKDILILSKINTYEYLEMKVKNALNDYKISDSKFIEKKNKIEELLNKMKSSFFLNEKKNNEFSNYFETLKKKIQKINNNNQKEINPNIFNNNREYKFSDDITIENLIYKMQRLYFEEINSTLFQNYYIELVKLLIEARNQINNIYSNVTDYKFINYKGIKCIINHKELTKKIKNIRPKELKKIIQKAFEYNNLNKKCISMKYELIIQYYLLSQIEDNFSLKLKLYELITLIDNLDESLFKGSHKEANISKETV